MPGMNSIGFNAENAKWNVGLASKIEFKISKIVSTVCDEDWSQNLPSGLENHDGDN